MPSVVPVVNRRRALVTGAVLVLGAVSSGCGGPPPPPAVDELESQVELARHDSELATAAAAAAPPQVRAALAEVAAERSQHAQALATEIARVAGKTSSASTETTSPTQTSPAPETPPPSPSDVINSLHASADSAAALATRLSGYRAGLLGSISASCTAAYTVALVFGKPKP